MAAGKTYISFFTPIDHVRNGKSIIGIILEWFLTRFIPRANPDFDGKIDEVTQWLLEFVDDLPNREIGLNANGDVIVKMPDERNYGYWTDNNLTLPDFRQHFDVTEIPKEHFRELWKSFTLR